MEKTKTSSPLLVTSVSNFLKRLVNLIFVYLDINQIIRNQILQKNSTKFFTEMIEMFIYKLYKNIILFIFSYITPWLLAFLEEEPHRVIYIPY